MDIRLLRYFLATANEGNITHAAKTLHITQPSLSKQLQELEAELKTTLFIRGKRKITLTEEGIILRKRAEEIISNLYEQNERNNSSNHTEVIRYLEYDLQCSMLKALEHTQDFQEYLYLRGKECHGKQALIERMYRVCESLQKEQVEDRREEKELCEKIIMYIQQNIADCNLNVTSIAEHFQII